MKSSQMMGSMHLAAFLFGSDETSEENRDIIMG